MKRIKLYFLLLMSVLSILLYTIALFFHQKQNTFHEFVVDYFEETIGKDSLSLHYCFLDPNALSIPNAKNPLPLYEKSTYLASKNFFGAKLTQLSDINLASLSNADKKNYAKLFESLTLSYNLSDYLYFDDPLSPYSGMQTQLPILLSEYQLHTKEDVEHYFELIEFLPSYFDSLVSYEKDRLSHGMILNSDTKDFLIDQCNSIVSESSIINSTHFMIETFENRLDKLLQTGGITSTEANTYKQTNHSLLLSHFCPAYIQLSTEIEKLQHSHEPLLGLYQYPNGRDYYELLFRQSTGSSLSLEELKETLSSSFQKNYESYTQTIAKIQALQNITPRQSIISLPFHDSTEMICNLQSCMAKDFPTLSNSNIEITTTVSTVAKSLEDYVAPAYYLTPPLDQFTSNVIYINERDPIDDISLYTTLAHEGYPGHLYQTTYYYSNLLDETSKLLAPLCSHLGYIEGWAYYVENQAYEYAKLSLPASESKQLHELYIDAMRQNRNLQLSLYCLLDVAIHYDGLTYDEIHDSLIKFGITDASHTYGIYEYIALNPTNYLTYYIGYEEVLSCKELAKNTWGTTYTDYGFHTLYLNHGPDSFSSIKKEIAP